MIIVLYPLLSRKAYSTVFPHLEPPVLINESETPKLTCKPAASIHYPLLNGYFCIIIIIINHQEANISHVEVQTLNV